jgi:FAD/FMN-containing dehydrogenase
VLSLSRLNRILRVDQAARRLQCEAGVPLEKIQQEASRVGLLYPVDFASKGSAQIGGSIATNAGGVKVLRYGLTRSWVQGLRVVTASGALLDLGSELLKDNAGFDLRQLFIGSEGTLGVIVEATLRLCVPPRALGVALCTADDLEGVLALFSRLRAADLVLSAFEIFDEGSARHLGGAAASDFPFAEPAPWQVLLEIEDASEQSAREALAPLLAAALEVGEVRGAVVAPTAAQASALWALREGISEALHARTPYKADVSVPLEALGAFVMRWRAAVAQVLPGVEAVCFGHLGDGNLHLNHLCPQGVSPDRFFADCRSFEPTVFGLVREVGGSIAAEHGVGLLKRAFLGYTRSPAEIAVMRRIKHALDPKGLFNPGKLFPD